MRRATPIGGPQHPRTRGVVQDAIDDDHEPSGQPLRHRFEADPTAVVHDNALPVIDVRLLTVGRPRAGLGSGDARPALHRPGSDVCHQLPSRVGNQLRWPDGRITDLNGNRITQEVNA